MHTNRKTKIVATIGPKTETMEMFKKVLHAGVNVARTNMSHGDHEEHRKRIHNIRAVSKKENIPVAILLDLAGPKIRIGDFKDGFVELVNGQEFILSGEKCEGDERRVFFDYPKIVKDLKVGQILMLDDGKKKLEVTKIAGGDLYTKVIIGGKTKSRRGVNLPGAFLSISALTAKDKKDLEFGIDEGVDFVALSFVRTAKDIEELRKLINKRKGNQKIISKIETEEAILDIDSIIEATDAVMVARGDLAVEIGPEKVPSIQKMIIQKSRQAGKPVIVATQMLESMITSPVPTRAEVSDAANAVFDGADAVMLSEETTLGSFPVEAVTTLHKVTLDAEKESHLYRSYAKDQSSHTDSLDALSSSIVEMANKLNSKAIVSLTNTGRTARLISSYRPELPILAATPFDYIARQLLLSYGCYPVIVKKFNSLEEANNVIGEFLKTKNLVEKGDTLLLSAGIPFKERLTHTNSIVLTTVK